MRNHKTQPYVKFGSLAIVVATAIACGGDAAGPTLRKDVMWDLTVFPRAVSLPVADTQPIVVRPLDYYGEIIDHDVSITYKSSDASRVAVSPTGVITAIRSTAGQGVAITVTIRAGLVTKTEYVWVGATNGPVDVDSISLRPAFGDPVVAVGSSGIVMARVFDSQGNEVSNVYSLVELADPENTGGFLLFSPLLMAMSQGKTLLRATLFVNGKLLSDSIEYSTRYREYTDLTVSRTPVGELDTRFASQFPTNIYVSPNAKVDFINKLTTPMDVTFERPDDVKGSQAGSPGGDIIALQPGKRIARWFPASGDYFFTVRAGSDSRRISVTVKE